MTIHSWLEIIRTRTHPIGFFNLQRFPRTLKNIGLIPFPVVRLSSFILKFVHFLFCSVFKYLSFYFGPTIIPLFFFLLIPILISEITQPSIENPFFRLRRIWLKSIRRGHISIWIFLMIKLWFRLSHNLSFLTLLL